MAVNGINNLIHDQPFLRGAGTAALFGAVGGAASFGIGQLAGSIASSIAASGSSMGGAISGAFQVGAHSILGGSMSVLQGGDFWSGALAGGISSAVASGVGALGIRSNTWASIATLGAGSLSGGIGSSIAGGNFWDGFRQGAITAGLNHLAHRVQTSFQQRRASLLFDGERLILSEDGEEVLSLKAVSGRPLDDGSFDYSIERQMLSFEGPVPEGDYTINPNKIQWWTKLGFVQRTYAIFGRGKWPGGPIAWGTARVWITPNGAETYGRNNFSIHGGVYPGSAGCIDLTSGHLKFFRTIQQYKYSIPLKVDY